jgi:RNA polymerase sigma-70 factor, ECF subfamily
MTILPGTPCVDDVARWLEQARAGSHEAFAELVRRHHRLVRVFLARFVRAPEAVDDLAQEVFLSAYRSLDDFDRRASWQTWLLGIARHRALHYLRGEARRHRREQRRLAEALDEWQRQQAEVEGFALEGVEAEVAALRACLQQLPPASLQVIKDHYYEGHTAEEIAVRLGRKGGAVRMLLLRLRHALRDCIQRRLAGEERTP